MKLIKLFADLAQLFKPIPRVPGANELIKQIMLTPIAFKQPKYLEVLLRHINNLALQKASGISIAFVSRDILYYQPCGDLPV